MAAEQDSVREISPALRAHYHALRARFEQVRQRYWLVKCAWCGKNLRLQRHEGASPQHTIAADFLTSHGICPSCKAYLQQE